MVYQKSMTLQDKPRFVSTSEISDDTMQAYHRGVMTDDQMAELLEATGNMRAANALRSRKKSEPKPSVVSAILLGIVAIGLVITAFRLLF